MLREETKVIRAEFTLQKGLKYYQPIFSDYFHISYVTVINYDLTDHILISQGINNAKEQHRCYKNCAEKPCGAA